MNGVRILALRSLAMGLAAGCAVDSGPLSASGLSEEVGAMKDRADMLTAQAESTCPRLVLATANGTTPAVVRAYSDVGVPSVLTCRDDATGDTVVKVGDFWIDKYEMSTCGAGGLGLENGNDTTVAACSLADVAPQVSITWFQASAMCANAGKHLCTNAEWQAAVSGTVDPGASGVGGACLTDGPVVRSTGNGAGCLSRFGAEDMIGNVWEWVAEWHEAGLSWQGHAGEEPTPRAGVTSGPWPAGYNDDKTWDVNGTAQDLPRQRGIPAAPTRGGGRLGGRAGAFAWDLGNAPSAVVDVIGARCCIGGR